MVVGVAGLLVATYACALAVLVNYATGSSVFSGVALLIAIVSVN